MKFTSLIIVFFATLLSQPGLSCAQQDSSWLFVSLLREKKIVTFQRDPKSGELVRKRLLLTFGLFLDLVWNRDAIANRVGMLIGGHGRGGRSTFRDGSQEAAVRTSF